jgi:hypothetical protein
VHVPAFTIVTVTFETPDVFEAVPTVHTSGVLEVNDT